jgi:hypothetical protein
MVDFVLPALSATRPHRVGRTVVWPTIGYLIHKQFQSPTTPSQPNPRRHLIAVAEAMRPGRRLILVQHDSCLAFVAIYNHLKAGRIEVFTKQLSNDREYRPEHLS